jgi:DNA gyrase subunit A
VFIAHTHDFILCFSSRGQVYWLKGYEVPAGTRASRGRPIVNLFPLAEGERISAVLPVKSFDDDRFVVMATANGTVKKTPLSDFSRPREKGIIAVDLEQGDYLIGVAITGGRSDVVLFSDAGKAVRFEEADVRPMGRAARGVRGMKLADEARVISMLVADEESKSVLTATENGYGKRTPLAEYPRYGRGTQGVIAIQTTERNGKVVGAALVDESDEIMLVSTGGVLIRTAVGQISKMGRATQGVSLISLDPGTKLAGIEKIAETEDENGNGGNGNGHGTNDGGHDPAPPRGNGEDHGD